MVELKRIGALSAAKIIGAVELVYGLALAVLLLLAGGTLSAFLGPSLSLFTGMGLIVLVALPVLGCVGAFLVYGIAALVYDALAPRMGGLILEIKGRRLNRIGVLSLGKFSAVAGAAIGLASGIFAAALAYGSLQGASAAAVAAVIVVATTIVTTLVLTVLMMVLALVYNAAASLMGGVILEISRGKLNGVGVESYTKMLALFGLIEGLFVGAIYATLSANPAADAALPSAAVSLGVGSIIAFPLVYLVIGIVCGASGAWLYNRLAKRIGGVELVLK